MVKPVWIAIAFAAGIAVGVLVTRTFAPESVPVATNDVAPVLPAAPQAPTAATQHDASKMPVPSASAAATAQRESSAPTLPPTAPASEDAAEYAGYSAPIDVGPAFRKEVTAAPVPGVSNALGEAHRALEREMRDDSWSYPMEAEIQNSLMADASEGNFTVEHVECRATACEIRLSAKGARADAMSRWANGIHAQPLGSRLLPSVSSMVSNGSQTDQILIFIRPPKPPKPTTAN
ncbi:MAG TPA: hypothetical protein VGO61_19115 [Steroidobacteraceae bacterium]|jgi:hypothetical protein|nr:hypothetical protein [Steroidobacteraceae bacterium]